MRIFKLLTPATVLLSMAFCFSAMAITPKAKAKPVFKRNPAMEFAKQIEGVIREADSKSNKSQKIIKIGRYTKAKTPAQIIAGIKTAVKNAAANKRLTKSGRDAANAILDKYIKSGKAKIQKLKAVKKPTPVVKRQIAEAQQVVAQGQAAETVVQAAVPAPTPVTPAPEEVAPAPVETVTPSEEGFGPLTQKDQELKDKVEMQLKQAEDYVGAAYKIVPKDQWEDLYFGYIQRDRNLKDMIKKMPYDAAKIEDAIRALKEAVDKIKEVVAKQEESRVSSHEPGEAEKEAAPAPAESVTPSAQPAEAFVETVEPVGPAQGGEGPITAEQSQEQVNNFLAEVQEDLKKLNEATNVAVVLAAGDTFIQSVSWFMREEDEMKKLYHAFSGKMQRLQKASEEYRVWSWIGRSDQPEAVKDLKGACKAYLDYLEAHKKDLKVGAPMNIKETADAEIAAADRRLGELSNAFGTVLLKVKTPDAGTQNKFEALKDKYAAAKKSLKTAMDKGDRFHNAFAELMAAKRELEAFVNEEEKKAATPAAPEAKPAEKPAAEPAAAPEAKPAEKPAETPAGSTGETWQ